MRSVAALSALAVPALALSYSHGDPRSVKRHHQLAEHVLEQRDQVVAPSSGRMARRIKRGEGEFLPFLSLSFESLSLSFSIERLNRCDEGVPSRARSSKRCKGYKVDNLSQTARQ